VKSKPQPQPARETPPSARHDPERRIVADLGDDRRADTIKILRAQVLDRLREIGGRTLLVTSAHPGEGKTVTAVNLAVSLAHELDRTAVIVDANPRRASVHGYFDVADAPGLTDYLLGEIALERVVIELTSPRLGILPAGRSVPNTPELFGAAQSGERVRAIEARWPDRIVVVDGAALLGGPDALAISRWVSGVLLVVESGRTPAADVTQALALVGDRPLLGTVLNKAGERPA
jgi:non-specific protein-tyrosine kinase